MRSLLLLLLYYCYYDYLFLQYFILITCWSIYDKITFSIIQFYYVNVVAYFKFSPTLKNFYLKLFLLLKAILNYTFCFPVFFVNDAFLINKYIKFYELKNTIIQMAKKIKHNKKKAKEIIKTIEQINIKMTITTILKKTQILTTLQKQMVKLEKKDFSQRKKKIIKDKHRKAKITKTQQANQRRNLKYLNQKRKSHVTKTAQHNKKKKTHKNKQKNNLVTKLNQRNRIIQLIKTNKQPHKKRQNKTKHKLLNNFTQTQKIQLISKINVFIKTCDRPSYYIDQNKRKFFARDEFFHHLSQLKFSTDPLQFLLLFFENKYKRLEKYGGVINEKILLQLIKELKNKNGKKHKKYYKKYTTPQMYINQKQKYYASQHCATQILFEITGKIFTIKKLKQLLKKYHLPRLKKTKLSFIALEKVLFHFNIKLTPAPDAVFRCNTKFLQVNKNHYQIVSSKTIKEIISNFKNIQQQNTIWNLQNNNCFYSIESFFIPPTTLQSKTRPQFQSQILSQHYTFYGATTRKSSLKLPKKTKQIKKLQKKQKFKKFHKNNQSNTTTIVLPRRSERISKRKARRQNAKRKTIQQKRKLESPSNAEKCKKSKQYQKEEIHNIARMTMPIENLTKNILEEPTTHNCISFNLKKQTKCQYCGSHVWPEEAVNNKSKKSKNEYSICCNKGKVKLNPLNDPPEELKNLLTKNDKKSKVAQDNLRTISNSLAFTSIGTTQIHLPGKGVPHYTVQGQLFHRISKLVTDDPDNPACAQIYFYSPEEQINHRLKYSASAKEQEKNKEDLKQILFEMQQMLEKYNPYIQMLKTAIEVCEYESVEDLQIILNADKKSQRSHKKNYSKASKHDVAIIIPGPDDNTKLSGSRDIVLNLRSGTISRVNELNKHYDSLQYVLLFPHGQTGFELFRKQNNGKKLSMQKFYKYKLFERDNEFNTILNSYGLLDQYVADMWSKIENQKLKYLRNNQKKIKASQYDKVKKAIKKNKQFEHKVKILPATFTNGPRYMNKKFHDAMAIVKEKGTPDLFVTMTCNPQWPEIKNNLKYNQKWWHKKDLCNRIFKLYLNEAVKDIKSGVLGKIAGLIYTIEWQKRGLPHAHFLIIFEEEDKIKTTTHLDSLVVAEFPNPNFVELYNIVTQHHIHGPCGCHGTYDQCQEKGKCSKSFPKEFSTFTKFNNDAYPTYKRRAPEQCGFVAKNKYSAQIDNRFIAPYNPWFTYKFNCHFFFESCNSIRAVKYIYKYCYKGNDRASFQFKKKKDEEKNLDEIQTYMDSRYLSSSEAFWRIMEFKTHDRFPAVIPLEIHLENKQIVNQFPDQSIENALKKNEITKLTAFFKKNKEMKCRNYIGRKYNLVYNDFPKYFSWNKNEWKERNRVLPYPTIGRIYNVHPNQTEKFFLRELLHTIKSPTSFEDLRFGCRTFQQACIKLGLAENDKRWEEIMYEASLHKFSYGLQQLFLSLLLFDSPPNVKKLWDKFKNDMAKDIITKTKKQDFLHDYTTEEHEENAYNQILTYLKNELLHLKNKTLENFDLPSPTSLKLKLLPESQANEFTYNQKEKFQQYNFNVSMMNEEQFDLTSTILDSVLYDKNKCVFIKAAAGTGKTFTLNTILHFCRSQNILALPVATSGIAALLFEGGRTINNRFRLIPPITAYSITQIPMTQQNHLFRLVRESKLIIWDEAVMAHKHLIEALDRSLKEICNNQLPFGGKTIVMSGDERQLLPITKPSRRSTTVNATLKKSNLWKYFEIKVLTENFRVLNNNKEFLHFLDTIGNGTCPTLNHDDPLLPNNLIKIPAHFVSNTNLLNDFTTEIFGDIANLPEDYFYDNNTAILTTLNKDTFDINDNCVSKIKKQKHFLQSYDSLTADDDSTFYTQEYINEITPTNFPRHKIPIFKGAPIICLCNLNPTQGLCNGTRLIVNNYSKNLITATISIGPKKGNKVFIPRIKQMDMNTKNGFTLIRKQFPIRLCFAMTIHKSQGQSLDKVGIYLSQPIFAHGMLYTAMSRIVDPTKLKILIADNDAPHGKINGFTGTYVSNIVYRETFS